MSKGNELRSSNVYSYCVPLKTNEIKTVNCFLHILMSECECVCVCMYIILIINILGVKRKLNSKSHVFPNVICVYFYGYMRHNYKSSFLSIFKRLLCIQ